MAKTLIPVEIAAVMVDITKYYNKAREDKNVNNAMSYALYHTLQKWNAKSKKKSK